MTIRTEADREQMFSRRALFVGAVQGTIGLTLAARMTYLSIFEQEKYKLLAEDNRVSIRLLPPRRGWVVDRNGKPIALNRPDYRLELVPEQVDDVEATLAEIMKVVPLPPEDLARIRRDIERLPGYVPIEIASNMDWATFSGVNVRLPDLPGVQPVRGFARYYPDGDAFGHLLGYVGAPTREQYLETKDPLYIFPGYRLGKDGIEKMLDDSLRGTAGARRLEVTARGRVLRDLETVNDKPGRTVKLTIDKDLQTYAARRIGEDSASVIVMDCWTGDILCMVSLPAFDPNNFSDGISRTEWKELQDDPRKPLMNKSVQSIYPPGSTFKMATGLAILGAGIGPEAGIGCGGGYNFGGHYFRCHKPSGHGGVRLQSALMQSCNVYFYHYGRAVGVDAIAAAAKRLGLGEKYDLPLPTQRKGIIPTEAWKLERYDEKWMAGETLSCAIGQGYVASNPLQLAVMTSRLASGLAVQPRLIDDGRLVPAKPLGFPAEHLALVRQGMADVVNGNSGTARSARLPIPGLTMAGKTGTAQAIGRKARPKGGEAALPWKYRNHAWFVAFAPVEAPRYAMSVFVEHGGGGSKAAAPIGRDVMTYLFEPGTAMKALEKIEEGWDLKKRERLAAQAAAAAEAQRAQAAAAQAQTAAAMMAAPPPPPRSI